MTWRSSRGTSIRHHGDDNSGRVGLPVDFGGPFLVIRVAFNSVDGRRSKYSIFSLQMYAWLLESIRRVCDSIIERIEKKKQGNLIGSEDSIWTFIQFTNQ